MEDLYPARISRLFIQAMLLFPSEDHPIETGLDFEKPIFTLEKRLQELRELAQQEGVDFSQEVTLLEKKLAKLVDDTFSQLNPWQRVQLSRHPNRPHARDYIDPLFPDFLELRGDRCFGDDQAMLGGTATWPPQPDGDSARTPILILALQKGRNTKQKMERNFGMARPEGYRKAIRLMRMADRFQMPVITFIDTPGAYPGMDAEERGQSQAIAESLEVMCSLSVPTLALVIGEGGSGGALALGIANKVLMQEFSTYSVISPESCASILWSNSSLAERAAEKLRMNPTELKKMGIVDAIVSEPKGGAHRDWPDAIEKVRVALVEHLGPLLKRKNREKLKAERLEKFRLMGNFALAEVASEDAQP